MDNKRLKELLKEKRIKQKDVANALNVTSATISQWVSGKREPNDELKRQLAVFLNVSIDFLLGGEVYDEVGSPNNISNSTISGSTITQINSVPDSFAIRHNQQDHLKELTPPGRSSTGGTECRPESSVIMIPVYRYSDFGNGVIPMHGILAPLAASKFGAYKEEDLFLIEQDIPFRMVNAGPVPTGYGVVCNRGFSFKSGFVYVVEIRGSSKVYRVTQYVDGTVDLQDDTGSKTLTVEQQEQVGYSVKAKIIAAVPMDIIVLE